MNEGEAVSVLRQALLQLRPSGEKGFEGLMGEVLRAVTGMPFRLLKAGPQEGGDQVAEDDGAVIVFEAKRYGDERPSLPELEGKIAAAAGAKRGPADVWILGLTTSMDPDDAKSLYRLGDRLDMGVIILDWSGNPPPLALLLSARPDVTLRAFDQRLSEPFVAALPEALRVLEDSCFDTARQQVIDSLIPANSHFRLLQRDALAVHLRAMANRSEAQRRYGQALTPLEKDAHGVSGGTRIERKSALERLDKAAGSLQPWRDSATDKIEVLPAPIVVLGAEGVGKTWLVADWWLRRHAGQVLVFLSAATIRSHVDELQKLIPMAMLDLLSRARDWATDRQRQERWLRRFGSSERFRRHARGELLFVVDGVNEAPQLYWDEILAAIWREVARLGGRLVVTCRPGFWRRSLQSRSIDWPEPELIPLGVLTEIELREALHRHGRTADQIGARALEQLTNPRTFALAMRLLDRLPPGTPLGADRLLFHYWNHCYAQERPASACGFLDTREFSRMLAEHAREFSHRRVESAHVRRRDLMPEEHPFNMSETAPVGGWMLDERTRDVLINEVLEGKFLTEVPDAFHTQYIFRRNAAGFALGLYVVYAVHGWAQSSLKEGQALEQELREKLATWLEPVADFDQTAGQMLAAVTIACLDEHISELERRLVIESFTTLRNRPDALYLEFCAIGIEAPRSFADCLESLLTITPPDQPDPWLLEAMRTAYRLSDGSPLLTGKRNELRRILGEWIVSPLPQRPLHRDYEAVPDRDFAAKRRLLAARVLAGLDLTPLALAFVDWSVVTAMEVSGALGASLSRVARSPVAYLLRCDLASPGRLFEEITAEAQRLIDLSVPGAREAARLLASVSGSDKVARVIESLSDDIAPITVEARELNSAESEATAGEEADSGLSDALTALGEQALANPNEFQQTVVAAIRADYFGDAQTGSRSSVARAHVLEVLVRIPGFAQWLRPEERSAVARSMIGSLAYATYSGGSTSNAWKVDAVLDSLLTAATAAERGRMLSLFGENPVVPDSNPVRANRFRPTLSEADLHGLDLDAVRAASSDDFAAMLPRSLLGAIVQHPISSLAEPLRSQLRSLIARPPNRSVSAADTYQDTPAEDEWELAVEIANVARDTSLATALLESPWSAHAESNQHFAWLGSKLLAQVLGRSHYEQIHERILSCVLPLLLDTVPDPHYEDLLNRIETALERACAAIIAGTQSVEEDGRRPQVYAHLKDFDAPTVAGAVRAWGWSITRTSKWLEAALTEAAISGSGSLTEHFAMALAMEAPPAEAALALHNLSALLERNVRGGRLNRPLLPRLLRACLIVATRSGPAGEDLFDKLVLSCAQDSSFANLATAILEIGAPALEMAGSWMTRALREGRPARCAGAITLAGYLSQDLANAETVLRSCGRENAHLRAVARQAKDCSVRSDQMKGWYGKRLESFDSVEAGAMEFLALHDATGVAPAAPLGELADADRMFVLRMRELATVQALAMGESFQGLRGVPPAWLIAENALVLWR